MERDGSPIEVDTRKATALMAYLAVTGEGHTRDAVAALLWPESEQARARAALRRTLSSLNKAIAGDGLEVVRDSLSLREGADVWVDVRDFRARLKGPADLAQLDAAAAIYRGDFLEGFGLRDSPAFDDWQFAETEGLRRELAGALEQLAFGHGERGDLELAIAYARRWIALDQLHESAHRHLMELFARSGRRNAALRQYRECTRVLDQELGVPPLPETTSLYEAIKEGKLEPRSTGVTGSAMAESPTPQTSRAAHPGETRPPAFPMVGRSRELATVVDSYTATGRNGILVAIEGEPGIGKTRLAQEFFSRARSHGATVVGVRCYEGESTLAYAPFTQALRSGIGDLGDISELWLAEASRLLPEIAELRPDIRQPPPLDGPGAQSRFFEGIAQVLMAVCGGDPPGVLFIDDLHWADDASLDLLTYLVRRMVGTPVCVLVSWRSDEVHTGHRLRLLLAEATRDGRGRSIALARLCRTDIVEMLGSVASSADADDLIDRLDTESEGLPFFLVEYLTVIAAGETTMPPTVRDLLQSRLASVDQTGRQLLAAAAVMGRSFDYETLRSASGRTEEEVVGGLEALISHSLVQEVGTSETPGPLVYDFTHEKLRTLVYEQTSLARQRLLHRRVAEALAGSARRLPEYGPMASRIAQHYQQAGLEREAADQFRRAGDHARSLYANSEALAHFTSALALGHPQPAALHEAIGDLQTLSGDYGAALNSYETAAAMCEPEALPAIEHKLGGVRHRRGDWELAESHYRSAIAAAGEEGHLGLRARVYADWTLTAHNRSDADLALSLAGNALELAEQAGDLRALAQVRNILGVLAKSRGDLDEARDHLQQSLDLAESLGDPTARVAALNNLALACGATGEIDKALSLAEAALDLCTSQGDRHRQAAIHNNISDLLHLADRTDDAMAHLKEAVTIFSEIGTEAGTMQPEIWKLVEW